MFTDTLGIETTAKGDWLVWDGCSTVPTSRKVIRPRSTSGGVEFVALLSRLTRSSRLVVRAEYPDRGFVVLSAEDAPWPVHAAGDLHAWADLRCSQVLGIWPDLQTEREAA